MGRLGGKEEGRGEEGVGQQYNGPPIFPFTASHAKHTGGLAAVVVETEQAVNTVQHTGCAVELEEQLGHSGAGDVDCAGGLGHDNGMVDAVAVFEAELEEGVVKEMLLREERWCGSCVCVLERGGYT